MTKRATALERDTPPGLTPYELEARASACYLHAGKWLAATFDLDLIVARRDAFAHAERWAARGLEAERHARMLRRSSDGSHHG